MDYIRWTSPCGLNCYSCIMYRAKDDIELREKVSRKAELPFEKAFCPGCRDCEGVVPFLNPTGKCVVYRCTRNRGIDFCSECEDFPCKHLAPVADRSKKAPHNTKVFNLCRIRKIGVERWFEEESERIIRDYFSKKLSFFEEE